MKLRNLALAGAVAVTGTGVWAECAFENEIEVKMLSAGFEAWKAVADAMAECGNFEAELDQEFRTKQPAAFAASPSLYHLGGVSNGTITPLLNEGTIRPLDDLVAEYGQDLSPNQLIRIDGKIMAIAMMVNTQHLQYRADILKDLGLEVPQTWDEVMAAAEKIQEAGVVDYPLGATLKSGWNLAQDFVNMFYGYGGSFVDDSNNPTINNEAGINALETMKAMTPYLDPEYLVSDSTYVQQQFQQGKIAMANLWASRAAAADIEGESQVVGLVETAAAPLATADGPPATTIWWDGIVVAANISDEEAVAAFKLIVEGLDEEMVSANNEAAIWLVPGYEPGRFATGAIETLSAQPSPPAYPSTTAMGLMHTALGNGISDYLTGAKDAETALADIEAAYITSAKEAGLITE
ncbi:carbohydrate ABC transporter substrate-binding protein, CUT1 family [Cribrihabitans marinus]|uniref:Carbohydrate ABC transporter substrate-binding protein, CUT1 family n=1 Tax=Cribrihabitans marinus TaxID=1227549 RepID=A0A1H7DL42_9RHOB|nr:extracellular solute-binding protein [Cribrihabitans marinus]SEK02446.1 carbohydrate ABC transporter substrate-binding protein, CUT1 family [Cribrihabitans marinus]